MEEREAYDFFILFFFSIFFFGFFGNIVIVMEQSFD